MNYKIVVNYLHILLIGYYCMINNCLTCCSDPDLIIATFADFHGQLEPAYLWNADGTLRECGGIARLKTVLKNLQCQYKDKMVVLCSGDFFLEDFKAGKYYKAFGGKAIGRFLNELPVDAATLGNHEFDFGVSAANKALQFCKFPIVATNLNDVPLSRRIDKKIIIHKNGYKIGLLGLMTDDIRNYKGVRLQFEPQLCTVTQLAVNELKNKDKVDFVVVLSHLGLDKDKVIAHEVAGIDVICGGHTHDITATGQEIIIEKSHGKTIILHTGDRGMFLGVLKLWTQEKGQLKYIWQLKEIDTCVPCDKQYVQLLEHYKRLLPRRQTIAMTTTPIDTEKYALRTCENGFANVVVSAIRDFFKVDFAVIPALCVRGRGILPAGPVLKCDLDTWFPFKDNMLLKLTAKGTHIKQALELGVADLPRESKNLLHVAGLKYSVDLAKAPAVFDIDEKGALCSFIKSGNRVTSVQVLQHDGFFVPLDEDREYSLIINSMMINRGYGAFFMFASHYVLENMHLRDAQVLEAYFKTHRSLSPDRTGRIFITK